jgi:hypothetical protein
MAKCGWSLVFFIFNVRSRKGQYVADRIFVIPGVRSRPYTKSWIWINWVDGKEGYGIPERFVFQLLCCNAWMNVVMYVECRNGLRSRRAWVNWQNVEIRDRARSRRSFVVELMIIKLKYFTFRNPKLTSICRGYNVGFSGFIAHCAVPELRLKTPEILPAHHSRWSKNYTCV